MTLWLKILEKVSFFPQKIDFDENMPPQIFEFSRKNLHSYRSKWNISIFAPKMKKIHAFQYFSFFDLLKRILQFFEHFAVENCRFFSMNKFMAWFFFMCKMRHGIIIFSQGGFQCLVKSSKSVTPNQPLMCEEGLCSSSFDLSHFNFLLLAMQIAPLFVTEFTVFLSRKSSKILLCIWKSDIFDTSSPWRKTN